LPNIIVLISRSTLARSRGRSANARWTIWFGLFECYSLLFQIGAARQILLAIEEDFAVNQGRINARIDAQGMSVPNSQVGVLPHFNRANPILNAKLPRGIDRDQFQRFFFGEIAVAHRFRSFDIQTPSAFVRIGIHGSVYAMAHHDGGVVGNCVISLNLISPEISESRGAGAVFGNLFRDFITFEHVLKGPDFEAKLIRNIDEHQNLIRAITVRVHVALAFQNLDQRFELQVATRRHLVFFASLNRGVVFVPGFLVIAGAHESVADRFFDAHTRGGIAALLSRLRRRTRSLRIFAERKLNSWRRARKNEFLDWTAILNLDRSRLATD